MYDRSNNNRHIERREIGDMYSCNEDDTYDCAKRDATDVTGAVDYDHLQDS